MPRVTNQLAPAVRFALTKLVEASYAESGASDAAFAERASAELKASITAGNVRGARETIGLPANLTMSATPEPAAVDVDALLGEVDARLHAYTADNAEALAAAIQRITEQHAALLRAVSRLGETADAVAAEWRRRFDAIAALLDGHAPAAVPSPAAAPVSPPAAPLRVVHDATPARVTQPAPDSAMARKLRVGILGLLDRQRAAIEKEFGDAFDLRIVLTEDTRGRAFLDKVASCDVVMAMGSFVGGTAQQHAKQMGIRYIRVSGAVTSLRDALTELYVETSGRAPQQGTA